MKIYLLETFDKDKTVEINPPLSEKGIRMSRLFSLTIKNLRIDNCYTDTSVASFGTALLLVGTKVKINKNQKLNKNVTVCSITLTPGLWLIIGYIDGNISSDFIYNNTLFDQTVRESMIGGGGSINVILRGIDTTTTVNLSTYDFVNVTSDLTYRGTLAAICLKPYL